MSRTLLAGTTNHSTVIRIVDSTDGTPETGVTSATGGLDLQYRREGAVSTAITESDLSLLTDAHSDGGMLHIGNGYYRLDLPDAAVAAGATGVLVHGTATGMVVIGEYIELVSYDPTDGVRLGLTALPNAAADAAGGLPISDAGGLDMDAILVDTNSLNDTKIPDTISLANINAECDTALTDYGGPQVIASGTAQAGAATTIQLAAASAFADDELIGARVEIISGTGAGQSRLILDYTGATDTATVHSWVTTPDATSVYQITGASADVQGWNLEGPADLTNSSFVAVEVHMWVGSSVTSTGGLPDVNTRALSGDSVAADNAEAWFDGTGYAASGSTIGFVDNLNNGSISPGSFLTDSISADALATDAVNEIVDQVWDELQSAHVTAGSFGEIATEIAAILVDTAEIGAAGAGLTEAGGTGDQLTALAPSSLLTTALTEGYATDGSTATAAQLLYMIWSVVAEFGISGTTLTARKLDGSTAAMTFTLNDGTNPTDRTRAT